MRKDYLLPMAALAISMVTACIPQQEPETAEAVKPLKPYSVETARAATGKPTIEVSEAIVEIPAEEPKTATEEPEAAEAQPDIVSEPEIQPDVVSEPDPVEIQLETVEVQLETVDGQMEPVQDSCFSEDVQYGEYYDDIYDLPSQEPEYYYEDPEPMDQQFLGLYDVTWYSYEKCGNNIGAAGVEGGLVEGVSIAMPEPWLLGHWIYVEGYGTFRVDDISDGYADIWVIYNSEIPGYGIDPGVPVYLLG